MKLTLDVVVPTRDSFSKKNYSIFYTLKSLLSQKNISLNITVVDDGSIDNTADKLKNDFHNCTNIVVLEQIHSGVAMARNYGATKGQNEHILFIDDDTILSSENMLRDTVLKFGGYSFSCGALRYWTPLRWEESLYQKDTFRSWLNILDKTSYLAKGVDRDTGYMDLTHISFIGNYGLIKRDVFESNGRFPELYKGWGMEDTHLMYMLCIKSYDYGIFKDENLKVYHLNHKVERNNSFLTNLAKFQDFQKEVGLYFSEAAFFNEYDGIVPVLRNANF